MNKRDFFWKPICLMLTGGVFFVDQLTKAWIVSQLHYDDSRKIIPGFLNFIYAYNPGVAFSMFDDSGQVGRWILSGIAGIAAILVLYYFWRLPPQNPCLLNSLALLLAGIAGNLTDRLRLGFVVDFIDVQFGSQHFPVFNIADMSICIGAGLLILGMMVPKKAASPNTL